MTARTNVAARLRASAVGKPDEQRILAAAASIEAGENDWCFAVRHERLRLEAVSDE
jgi:class 3 adenylate cyclase